MKKATRIERQGILRKILLSKQFCISILVIMSLVAFISVIKVVLGFMPVKNYTVVGDTHYDINEIIDAAEIQSGDKLYKINKKEAAQKIVKECPYIKTVKIKQQFPNTVCFVVEEQEAGWYIQVGDMFYGLNADMKVLVESRKEDSFIERGLTKLVLPNLESVIVGELPEFSSDDVQLKRETLEIIHDFRSDPIKERLTGLDISNRFQIKLEIDNAYEVEFGDKTSFDTKMEMLVEILKWSAEKGHSGGKITYDENTGAVALQGIYPDSSETEEEDAEDSDENDIND